MLENRDALNKVISNFTEKKAISGISQTLAATVVIGLSSIPTDATRALIVAEVASVGAAADATKLFRYWENGVATVPSATSGIIRGHGDAFSVEGRDNLESLRFYGVEASSAVTIQVQFYK